MEDGGDFDLTCMSVCVCVGVLRFELDKLVKSQQSYGRAELNGLMLCRRQFVCALLKFLV